MSGTRNFRTLFGASLLGAAGVFACGGGTAGGSDSGASGSAASASSAPGAVVSREPYESEKGQFTIDLPGIWHGGYRAIEHADTVAGSRYAVDFMFTPDPAWKVEPRALMVVRIFSKAAWDKLNARPGPRLATKVAERGDDIFTYSVPGSNPYKTGTPAEKRFDEMVLAVVPGLNLTPR